MTRFGLSPLRVVVGAGTGASLPRSLRRIGAHVEVHEQTPALARVGAGLQLAPNATSALRGLGPLERVCAIACRPESWNSFDAADGALTLQLPLGEQVEETWTEESWAAEGKVGDLLDALSGFAEPARRMAGAASSPPPSALHDREPLGSWDEGRAALLARARARCRAAPGPRTSSAARAPA